MSVFELFETCNVTQLILHVDYTRHIWRHGVEEVALIQDHKGYYVSKRGSQREVRQRMYEHVQDLWKSFNQSINIFMYAKDEFFPLLLEDQAETAHIPTHPS